MTKVRTLMLLFIMLFCGATWSHYVTLAEDNLPKRPDFEHTNNKTFLTNVKQCVDYVYFYNQIEEVNLELLLAQAALESGAYINGHKEAGVFTSVKHFPGHGDTDKDSHKTLPVINGSMKRLNEVELYPFKKSGIVFLDNCWCNK